MGITRSPQVFSSGTARRRFFFHAVVAAVVVLAAGLLVVDRFEFLLDPDDAREFVASFGVFAPLALIVLQALQVLIAPIPGQVLAIVAGYLFGAWLGTFYNMIGIAIGSTAAFWLSRRYGRSYVEEIVHPEIVETFDAIGEDNVLATLFVLFLIPGLPDDVLCFVGGLTNLKLRKLVAVALVGRAPGFFLINVFGDRLGSGDFVGATMLAVVLLGASVLGYVYRGRLLSILRTDDSAS
ncbi:TVP38/TMEM64 family protein [Salinarchaeum laminariae]|uniref:TVP38/TMEM64 family protein n=1 Tax=Salinarchaeum laminariae TaxID=869888 RepID=UPI0020C16AF8|nr:TVP38/TMEM64 family protein [Salinarchaeum laminariae]